MGRECRKCSAEALLHPKAKSKASDRNVRPTWARSKSRSDQSGAQGEDAENNFVVMLAKSRFLVTTRIAFATPLRLE
jgi:hypothetical protein